MTTKATGTVRTTEVRWPLLGPFSLREAALFGFGHRRESDFDGVMRLAFCVDDYYESTAGVALRQDGDALAMTIESAADPQVVAAQAARVVSADHDGRGFAELGERDEVIGALQAAAPGLRPVLFHSPYEGAAWSIISARRGMAQGRGLRERLNTQWGSTFTVAGQPVTCLPPPSRLREITTVPGLPADRVPRLHAIAEAASQGRLSARHLQEIGADAAAAEVQQLPGIGPFYSGLIVVRATGFADVLPLIEARARALAHELYGLPEPLDDAGYLAFAERWAPWRTWATVLIRAGSGRLPASGILPR